MLFLRRLFGVGEAGASSIAIRVIAQDQRCRRPSERIRIRSPIRVQDFLATIYGHLGIDHEIVALSDQISRPIHITENGSVILELVAST